MSKWQRNHSSSSWAPPCNSLSSPHNYYLLHFCIDPLTQPSMAHFQGLINEGIAAAANFHPPLCFLYLGIPALNVPFSTSLFPFLLPQPQKSPHPLPPYHSSFAVPPLLLLLLLSIHLPFFFLLPLTANLNLSLYLYKTVPRVSLSRVCVCACVYQWWMKDKVITYKHTPQTRRALYIWNFSARYKRRGCDVLSHSLWTLREELFQL